MAEHVLVIDDSADTIEMLEILLADLGCEVDGAVTLEEAETLIIREPFKVVFLDSRLPDGDGVEFCRRLRSEYSDLPIIIYTGAAEPESRRRAEGAGCSAYLVKPCPIDELMRVVNSMLSTTHV
jgi:DNA-binding response OmpR family regulator